MGHMDVSVFEGEQIVVVAGVANKRHTTSNVAAAYFDLRAYDLQFEIAGRTLVSRHESLQLTKTQADGGARFSLATPSIPVVLTGPSARHPRQAVAKR